MDSEQRKRLIALSNYRDDPRQGRPIEELIKTDELLKGFESQRLRTYFSSICMEPGRDLDDFGQNIASGDLMLVQTDFMLRFEDQLKNLGFSESEETNNAAWVGASQELYNLRWGPTKTPIFNLLGLFMQIVPSNRSKYLEIARYLIGTAKVPVDGVDLSGTTALSHCFSTKPGFDLEYAQILYDAGGDVNHRNRYGCTVAQEICQIYQFSNPEAVRKATASFTWFLSHGGNVDIVDTDGWTVRKLVPRSSKDLQVALDKDDKRRAARGDACCTFCGREDIKLLRCGQCKKAVYCQPSGRRCQKADWPRHKKGCKA